MRCRKWILLSALILFIDSGAISSKIVLAETNEDKTDIDVIIKRDAQEDTFLKKADQMAMVARVVTAIALRVGLSDGSIRADEAISELLNIASVKLGDLEKFDKAKIDELSQKLDGLQVKNASSVGKLEADLILVDTWAKMFAKLKDPNGCSKTFYDKLKDFKSYKLSSPLISELSPKLKNLVATVERIPKLPDDTATKDTKNGAILQELKELKVVLSNYTDLWQTISQLSKEMDEFKPLVDENQQDHFRFIWLAVDFSRKAVGLLGPTTSSDTLLSKMFDDMTAFFRELEAAPHFNTLTEIVLMKNVIGKISKRQHTPGLLNGFNDMQNVSKDIRDPWMTSTIRGFDAARLAAGLAPLTQLYSEMDIYADRWKSLISTPMYDSIRLSADAFSSRDIGSAADAMKSVVECVKAPNIAPKVNVDVRNAVYFQFELRGVFKALSNLTSLGDWTQMTTALKDSINFSKNVTMHLSELPTVIAQVKAFDKMDELIRVLKESEQPLKTLHSTMTGNTLMGSVDSAAGYQTEVDTFLGGSAATELANFFKCPIGKSNEMTAVLKGVQLVRKVRKLQERKASGEMVIASKVIAESAVAVPNLRTSVTTIVAKKPDSLKDLSALKSTSKPLGDAVTALMLVRRVLEKKASVDILVNSSHLIDSQIQKIYDEDRRFTVASAWGDTKALTTSLSGMMKSLEAAMSAANRRRRQNPTGLAHYGKLFTNLAALKDVDIDVDQRLKALDTLPTNPEIAAVRKALVDVGTLDLKFSRFTQSLSGMTGTLGTIETVFLSSTTSAKQAKTGNSVTESKKARTSAGLAVLFYVLISIGFLYNVAINIVCIVKVIQHKRHDKKMAKWREEGGERRSGKKKKTKNSTKKKKETKKKGKKGANEEEEGDVKRSGAGMEDTVGIGRDAISTDVLTQFFESIETICENIPFETIFNILDKNVPVYSAEEMPDVETKSARNGELSRKNHFGHCFKCFEKTAVRLTGRNNDTPFYHANYVTFPHSGRAIAAQSPTEASVSAFLWMVWQEGVEQILMLDDERTTMYFGPNHGDSFECDEFRVTTVDVEASNDGVVTRTLILEKVGVAEKRKVKHVHIVEWAELGSKATRDAVMKVHRDTRGNKTPLLVHCLDGSSRTTSYLGIEFLTQLVVIRGRNSTLSELLFRMRSQRDGALNTAQQLFFTLNMALQCMIEDSNLVELEDKMHKRWLNCRNSNILDAQERSFELHGQLVHASA